MTIFSGLELNRWFKIKCAINYVCSVNVLKVFHLLSVLLEIYKDFIYCYFGSFSYLLCCTGLYSWTVFSCQEIKKENLIR